MKATILCGTADNYGCTSAMCDAFCDVMSGSCDVDMFMISEMDIGHCRDCGGCKSGRCVIRDDMDDVFSSFHGSDILVLAAPIHFSGPSSLIKTVMDRFQPCWFDNTSKHPKYCIGLLCGGSEQPNFNHTEHIFKAFCITVGMEYLGSAKVPATDSGYSDAKDMVADFISSIRPKIS